MRNCRKFNSLQLRRKEESKPRKQENREEIEKNHEGFDKKSRKKKKSRKLEKQATMAEAKRRIVTISLSHEKERERKLIPY